MDKEGNLKIIETHIHGGFGVNFNTGSAEDIHSFARNIKKDGVLAFYPTLATDNIDGIKKQADIIREVKLSQKHNEAKILGIHLEGCFLNKEKKGIHNEENFLKLTPDNFKKFNAEDIIKIVTLAPELDEGLIDYLVSKDIKVHAGHTLSNNMKGASATTHHFNAMPKPNQAEFLNSISCKALHNDDIYCEIIGDLIHNDYETLKMFFETKPHDKIILVSDALPIAHSDKEKIVFCDKEIYQNGKDKEGKLGGSVLFLSEIIKKLLDNKLISREDAKKAVWDNPIKHLDIKEEDIL